MEYEQFVGFSSVVMPVAVEMLKSAMPEVNPRIFAIGFCVAMGTLYAVMSAEFGVSWLQVAQQWVWNFVKVAGVAFTAGTAIYKIQK